MSRSAVRQLGLLLLLLLPFASLGQYGNDGEGAYGGDNNTTSPAPQPQPNVTQPAPSTPPQQQPNATAPSTGGGGNGNATQPSTQPNATAPVASTGNATAFLPITLSNNNSWTANGRDHEQNNYLMQNTASRPICDVSIKAPIAGNSTRVYSSYNVDLTNTTARAMHFDLPFYLHKIWPGQVVSFGWILNVSCVCCDIVGRRFIHQCLMSIVDPPQPHINTQSDKNGTQTGGMANVTHARFCEHDDNDHGDHDDDDNNHDDDDDNDRRRRFRRRRVLVRNSPWA